MLLSRYVDAGEYMKAIELLCENHGVEPMMDLVHKLEDVEKYSAELRTCAQYFATNNHHSKAKQVYLKMNAIEELLDLHMKMHKWEEALALCEQYVGCCCGLWVVGCGCALVCCWGGY